MRRQLSDVARDATRSLQQRDYGHRALAVQVAVG